MDRRAWKHRFEDEKLGEKVYRARIVLVKDGGEELMLEWSERCEGLKRAKQGAAEIAIEYIEQNATLSPAATSRG